MNLRAGGYTFCGGLLDLRPDMAAEVVKPCVCICRGRCCRQALKKLAQLRQSLPQDSLRQD